MGRRVELAAGLVFAVLLWAAAGVRDLFTRRQDGRQLTGTLIGRTADTLMLKTDTGATLRLPAADWSVTLTTRPRTRPPTAMSRPVSLPAAPDPALERRIAWLKTYVPSDDPDTSEVRLLRIRTAILKREIFLGMTREEVRHSWGRPASLNTITTKWSREEQWRYGDPLRKATYLYFTDGFLTAWQTSE